MDKPSPARSSRVGSPFWEALDRDELVYQWCSECGHAQYYPRSLCVKCAGAAVEWRTSSGHGTVYSFTEVLRAPDESFKADVPYIIALIDVAEGFRVMTNVLAPPATVRIAMPVRAIFESRGAHKLLQFEAVA